MKVRRTQRFTVAVAGALLAIAGLGSPQGLQAQQAPEAGELPEVTEEDFEAFVRVHLAVEEIRDQLHEDIARWHDEHEREQARQRADDEIEAVLEEHDVTAEELAAFTHLVSVDEESRERFEQLLSEIDGDDR